MRVVIKLLSPLQNKILPGWQGTNAISANIYIKEKVMSLFGDYLLIVISMKMIVATMMMSGISIDDVFGS